jgi:ribonuclease HII
MAKGRRHPFGEPDREAFERGYRLICGVDEVGRGPLAGPVVAAAVVFPPGTGIPGLGDSKQLTSTARSRLLHPIRSQALGIGLGVADPAEIDRINILQASLSAMRRAVADLAFEPDLLLIDGIHTISLPIPQQSLVAGDGRSVAIAAASIVAKEHRDEVMRRYAVSYPGYGFETHKGYPTRSHREALERLGPSPIHRTSFRGVEYPRPVRRQGEFFEGR